MNIRMFWLKNNKYIGFLSIFLILLISIPALLPLLQNGFFVTDDGEWMIIRFSAFYQALADGQFPVRFLHRLNFDYGYPVATFLYPGFMYAAIPFHVLKVGVVDTIKIILGLSLIGTTVFTFFWLRHVFRNHIAAVVGAIVSLYLPYHLYDVYTRGSVGEIFALLWVPFILWMIEREKILFVSLGIALLLISHNTLALLFLPFLFLYALIRDIIAFKRLFVTFFLGILLASFFIIPAIFELSFTYFSKTSIANPTQYFATIKLIGFETLLIFFLSLVLIFSKKKLVIENKLLISFFLFMTFLSILFSSSFSEIFWQILPSSFIQFPFRLLSYLVITLAFLSAFIIAEVQKGIRRIIIVIFLSGIIIISSSAFLAPKAYLDKGEGHYLTNDATTTVQDEYLPVWVKEKFLQRAKSKAQIIKGEGKIEQIVYNNKEIGFIVQAEKQTTIQINTIYWPGWELLVNNQKTEFSYNNPAGVITFEVPNGTHQVRAVFGETPLRLIADAVSVASLLILIYLSFPRRRESRNKTTGSPIKSGIT